MSEKSCTFAPKINMTTLIDISKFAVIDEIALQKTRYLRKYYTFSQRNGGKEEISFTYLRRLLPEHTEELPDSIARVFSDLGRVHLPGQNDLQTIGSTQVHISQLIWARLCVAAYYFFHDEPLWQDLVFRKLEERVQAPELAADILTAKALIDTHYRERALLSGKTNVHPTPPSAMEIATEAAKTDTNPKSEDIFNFAFQRTRDYRSMLEVLEAEKKDCSDIEWARHALTIYRHKNAFVKHPSSFAKWLSVFGKMFGREVAYREPNKLDKGQNKVSLEPFLPR
jgi:hypothetical protein